MQQFITCHILVYIYIHNIHTHTHMISQVSSVSKMRTRLEERFSEFYETWVSQLESQVQLIGSNNRADQDAFVGRLTAHHKAYYTAKWAAAHEDVLTFFSPVWLTRLENAFLWMTGWKPSTAFRLVNRAGMSEERVKGVEELRARVRMEEEKVEREMERIQVMVPDRGFVELARLTSRAQSGDAAAAARVDGMVDAATKNLLAGLEKVMKMADCARLKTLKGILELLEPEQCVNFLAATSMLQIQLRRFGKNIEEKEKQKVVNTYNETTGVGLGNLVIV